MNELEKLNRAKLYIDKLANGINPIDDSPIPDDDTINHVRIVRCLFYVSDILNTVIENGGFALPQKNIVNKSSHILTEELRTQLIPSSDSVFVSDIAEYLNDVLDKIYVKRISGASINRWLIAKGFLEEREIDGKRNKYPTSHGSDIGIIAETRHGHYGDYTALLFSPAAQQFIFDNSDAIIHYRDTEKSAPGTKHGQPWDENQDTQLITMYTEHQTISEMAAKLKRTKSAIRARLRRLGLLQ